MPGMSDHAPIKRNYSVQGALVQEVCVLAFDHTAYPQLQDTVVS